MKFVFITPFFYTVPNSILLIPFFEGYINDQINHAFTMPFVWFFLITGYAFQSYIFYSPDRF